MIQLPHSVWYFAISDGIRKPTQNLTKLGLIRTKKWTKQQPPMWGRLRKAVNVGVSSALIANKPSFPKYFIFLLFAFLSISISSNVLLEEHNYVFHNKGNYDGLFKQISMSTKK